MGKIIFLDVDGTLVDYENRLPDSAVTAVRRARENGHRVYICTGRSKAEVYPETVLLIDIWKDQASIDRHHASPMMEKIAKLRVKYNLDMKVERYVPDEGGIPETDRRLINVKKSEQGEKKKKKQFYL